jgi:hypothetical protein
MASIAWISVGDRTADTASAITRGGIASAISVSRMIAVSVQPPK